MVVDDFAVDGRKDARVLDLDGAHLLAVRARHDGENCGGVALSRDLAADDGDDRGLDALVRGGKDAGVHSAVFIPFVGIDLADVGVGSVRRALGVTRDGLDDGVADIDVAAAPPFA